MARGQNTKADKKGKKSVAAKEPKGGREVEVQEERSASEEPQDRTPQKARVTKKIAKGKQQSATPKKSTKKQAKDEVAVEIQSDSEQQPAAHGKKRKHNPSEDFAHNDQRQTLLNLVMNNPKKSTYAHVWDLVQDKYRGISESQFCSYWCDLEKEGTITDKNGSVTVHRDEIAKKEEEKRIEKERKEQERLEKLAQREKEQQAMLQMEVEGTDVQGDNAADQNKDSAAKKQSVPKQSATKKSTAKSVGKESKPDDNAMQVEGGEQTPKEPQQQKDDNFIN